MFLLATCKINVYTQQTVISVFVTGRGQPCPAVWRERHILSLLSLNPCTQTLQTPAWCSRMRQPLAIQEKRPPERREKDYLGNLRHICTLISPALHFQPRMLCDQKPQTYPVHRATREIYIHRCVCIPRIEYIH